MRSFNPQDRLSRAHEILSTEIDQETVLMSIDAEAYYGLKGPARSIWEKLQVPITFSALVDLLVKEYRITPEACAADLNKFLGEMDREGLLRVE
ncbi:MAG: PqqD family peptide modification chaperone [Terracidiphilus sp.]